MCLCLCYKKQNKNNSIPDQIYNRDLNEEPIFEDVKKLKQMIPYSAKVKPPP